MIPSCINRITVPNKKRDLKTLLHHSDTSGQKPNLLTYRLQHIKGVRDTEVTTGAG